MTSIALNICTAIGAALLILYTAKETSREDKKRHQRLWLFGYFLIAFYIGIFSIWAIFKNEREKVDQEKISNSRHSHDSLQIVSLQTNISDLKYKDSTSFAKIDSSLKPYRLELENFKAVPITFNFENNSQNVTSNNQKGGQTAGKIINHK